MSEYQGGEWMEIWNDEYLNWICGYANAQGGMLIIGKDDNAIITNTINRNLLGKSVATTKRKVACQYEINYYRPEGF